MAVDEATKERLRSLLVEMVIEFRRGYLRTPQKNLLKHWQIILNRMRSAVMSTSSVDEWVTQVQRRLQIPALGNSGSSALLDLGGHVREHDLWAELRDIVWRETGLIEALARRIAETAAEDRDAAKAAKGSE